MVRHGKMLPFYMENDTEDISEVVTSFGLVWDGIENN
jgi:hypothetical protein